MGGRVSGLELVGAVLLCLGVSVLLTWVFANADGKVEG